MAIKTFPGGVHPPTLKKLSSNKPIKIAPLPEKVILPLVQHTGAPCRPKVEVGEYVKRGRLIAEADAFISSPLHSSISGVVKEINKFPHPAIGECEAIVIEGDSKDIADKNMVARRHVESLKTEELLDIIKRSGIVGLGGAAFPTHVKLAPPKAKPIDTVLLNGAECEPYLSCDYRLMLEKPKQLLKGLAIIMKVLSAKRAHIAIEDNKTDVIPGIRTALTMHDIRYTKYDIRIIVLKTKYPQGGEKQLIKAALNRAVPPEKLPFEVGCVVSNVGTAYAIYEAIYENKPLYERVVTVSGASVSEPQNLLVRIGTPVSALVDACAGFKYEVDKIIFGGPMMGLSQYTLEVPIIKGTSGVVFLTEEEARPPSELPCIKCARCVDVCPVNLIPTRIYQFVKKQHVEGLSQLNPIDCIECGACSYDCPSKIPLLHYIKIAKAGFNKKK